MLSVSQSGPQATGAWMKEFGGWYFDLARNWYGTFIHQGRPVIKGDHTEDWVLDVVLLEDSARAG